MKSINQNCALPLLPAFVQLVESEWNNAIERSVVSESDDVVLNFRDPAYSAETGGFHPVEVYIRTTGDILYITDFAYVGQPPYAELAKELDFDFGLGLFGQAGRDYAIAEGAELFALFQANFCSYVVMGVFKVTISAS